MSRNGFTRAVVAEMQGLYPESLADTAWDNVGLLLDNTTDPDDSDPRSRILLTNDLTTPVVDEAIQYKVNVIIAYHPIIFRGLKSITLKDAQQASIIRLAQNNIAVYCPHTALDAAKGGINDWLVDKVLTAAKDLGVTSYLSSAIQPVAGVADKDVGYGRDVQLDSPVSPVKLVRGVAKALGGLRHVLVVRPMDAGPLATTITRVAVCAGSGSDILKNAKAAQFYLTGEMSHHAALEAASRGVWVMCVLHSRSERRFLQERLRPQLAAALETNALLAASSRNTAVLVSEQDRDPFEIWDVSDAEPEQPVRLSSPGEDDTERHGV